MAYLGNDLQVAFPTYRNIDDISGSFNGVTTSFPLTVAGVAPIPAPINSQQCLISVNGVVQRPDDSGTEGFRLSGGNIIFASAPAGGVDFFGVILAGADYVNIGANFPSGTAVAPSITFDSDLDTGIYNPAGNQIGFTTSGVQRLVINSSGQISGGLGTAAAPVISFISDPNTGIYSPGADQVAISTGGSGRLFVDASGRVGIGVSSLGDIAAGYATLQIGGTNGGGVRVGTSSAVAGYMAGSASGVEIGTTGTTALNFFTNNQARATITSAGLVGVGTSSPSYVLDVAGSARVKTGATGTPFIVSTGSDSQGSIRFGSSGGVGVYGIYGGADYTGLQFWTGGVQSLTIDNSQRVGIGFSSVEAALHAGGNNASPVILAGADSAGNDVKYTFRQSRGTITSPGSTGGEGIKLSFEKRAPSSWASPIAEIYAAGDGDGATGYLEFLTKPSGGSATPRARIDSSGRLLVGTSSARSNFFNSTATARFQVEGVSDGDIAASIISSQASVSGPQLLLGHQRSGSIGGNTVLQYVNGTTSDDQLGLISFQGSDGTEFVEGARIQAYVDGTPGANDMPGRLVFSTTADGASSPTQALVIKNNQDVLCTTTTAATSSNGWYGMQIQSASGGVSISRNGSNVLAFFHTSNPGGTSGTPVGTISITTTSTAYSTSSDYRLKENVTPVTDGITRLQQLKPSRFNFIADPAKMVDGFLAHEVQNIVPEAITGEKDAVDDDGNPIYQGIDQSKLVPLLTAALQEAIGEIESLKARVAALESA